MKVDDVASCHKFYGPSKDTKQTAVLQNLDMKK